MCWAGHSVHTHHIGSVAGNGGGTEDPRTHPIQCEFLSVEARSRTRRYKRSEYQLEEQNNDLRSNVLFRRAHILEEI